jgi:tetratricopeptide (TPR) repeat protein
MMSIFAPIQRHKIFAVAMLSALLALGAFLTFSRNTQPPPSPAITTPALAIETMMEARAPYFTVEARDYLAKKKPEWVALHDTPDDRRDFLQSGQNPVLWRQLDHKYHFDAILLCGDPTAYRVLLDHLVDTKDWKLTYVDHTSFIFKRPPAKPWEMESYKALLQKFANYSKPEHAMFLTEFAAKLLSIGQPSLAKMQLDEALSLNKKSPETWIQMGWYHFISGKAPEALQSLDHALELDRDNPHALSTKAQILYGTKRFADALGVSSRLVEASPDDPNVLFFHAKIAHEAHAYAMEIPTLKHLIEVVEEKHGATSGFRIYLAQAYARDGQAAASLDEFEKAKAGGGLSKEQMDYIDESILSIRNRTQL